MGRVIKDIEDVQEGDNVDTVAMSFYAGNKHKSVVLVYTQRGVEASIRASVERLQDYPIYGLRIHDAEDDELYSQATTAGAAVDTLVRLREVRGLCHPALTRCAGGRSAGDWTWVQ